MSSFGYDKPGSALTPQIVIQNVTNRETVYQRLLLVHGTISHWQQSQATLLVTASDADQQGKYDPQVWQVNHG